VTESDWHLLDKLAERLKAGYEGHLKGTPPMIRSSMRIAYEKGVRDTLQLIVDKGFDMKQPEGAQ
jgi:hypothetical protein